MKLPIFSLVCVLLQSSISFAQELECTNDGIVYYLPHSICTQYIMCIYGRPSIVYCEDSLYYNPRSERCEYPENVPECVGGTRPPLTTTTEQPSTTTEEPQPSTTETPPSNTLTECGQNIKADSGFIEYKLNENYNAGELCAFIIQLDEHDGCDFTLETNGFNDTYSDTIIIFRMSGDDVLQSSKLDNMKPTAYLSYSEFVVIFKTTTDLGTGFRLRFESRQAVSRKLTGSHLVFNNQTSSPLRFPFYPNLTSSVEMDTVVILSGAELLTDPDTSLQLKVDNSFVDPGCNSWFMVHSFDGEHARFEARICGLNDGKKAFTFNTKGLFIVVFYKRAWTTGDYLGSLEWF